MTSPLAKLPAADSVILVTLLPPVPLEVPVVAVEEPAATISPPEVIFIFDVSAVSKAVVLPCFWIWNTAVESLVAGFISTPVLLDPDGLRLMPPLPAWIVVVLLPMVDPAVILVVEPAVLLVPIFIVWVLPLPAAAPIDMV